MTRELQWADGGLFRVVDGRRVWVERVPASVRDEMGRDAAARGWRATGEGGSDC